MTVDVAELLSFAGMRGGELVAVTVPGLVSPKGHPNAVQRVVNGKTVDCYPWATGGNTVATAGLVKRATIRGVFGAEWAAMVTQERLRQAELAGYRVGLLHGRLKAADRREVMRAFTAGELDVLDGSPPCQGFSTAGKRKMDDGRNQLFREYVRLLRGLIFQPRFVGHYCFFQLFGSPGSPP